MADMRDRLIELLHSGVRCPGTVTDCWDCPHHSNNIPCDEFGATVDMLLANGVILPPCKVGDDIYSVEWSYRLANYILVKYTVKELLYSAKRGIRQWIVVCLGETRFNNQDFGKTVFLTLEEAQEAHKERNSNEKR